MCRCADFECADFENVNYIGNFDKMASITAEINKEQNLPEDWADLSDAEIEAIKAGLEDIKAGRTHTHAEVMSYIGKKLIR